jgi:uncharacterized protein (TIGR03435 family)
MSIRVAPLALVTLFATVLAATTAIAQEPSAPSADASSATFEVAAVRPSNPNPDPSNPLSMVPLVRPHPGGRVTVTNTPLKMLIGIAYEMQDFRVSGGPPDLMNAKFDITAKAAVDAVLTQKEMAAAIKDLLIERFKLKTHTEQREMRLYDLVMAHSDGRLGPDMKPSTSDCSKADELNARRLDAAAKGDLAAIIHKPGEALTCTIAPNVANGPLNISVHGDGQEIKQLIELLTMLTGRHIRDKTGLTGRYDFDMKLDLRMLLAMAQGMGMPVPAGAAEKLPQSDGASLMTALNEQLGLKLDSVRAEADVLVIDSVEAPTQD